MLNVLVISPLDEARQRFAGWLADASAKVSFKTDVSEAAPLVELGVFDAIFLLVDAASEHAIDELRTLRKLRAGTPVTVVVRDAPLPWEESALAAGAESVLREPLAAPHVESVLRRLPGSIDSVDIAEAPPADAPVVDFSRGSLEILRDFSRILGYSLDHELFAEQFVRKVREIVGVARIAVFLENPRFLVGSNGAGNRLSCVAAIGVSGDILDCFELSRSSGIGARMVHAPQVMVAPNGSGRTLGAAAQKIQREFEILGCRVAIPITDRTRTIGVAMLGGHVTGRSFTPDELQLLFLLMEELGSAIKNTWLHQQLSASHRLLADVLAAMSSGCLVVDSNLHVLHANRAMVAFIKGDAASCGRLDFADLPPKLANPLYDTVVKGTPGAPFFFTGGAGAERLFHVSIISFKDGSGTHPQSAMLVLEDFTQIEAAKRFEIEASKAKLIALIAKRFAHEIRNSLVPLATHEQLLDSEYQNDDFRRSLKTALHRETGRIQRFTEQMLFLAQPARVADETVNLRDLVESCFERVSGSQAPAGRLQIRSDSDLPLLRCHRPALEHALQEVLTNALQGRPEDPLVTAQIETTRDGGIRFVVTDNGPGFNEDTARQATDPFFTTRNTGVGLGLTVARKIVEDHHGRLAVGPRGPGHEFDIEIWLPAAAEL